MDERETRLSINSISMYNMNGLNFLFMYYSIGYQKDLLCVDLPPPPLNAAKINALLDNAKVILRQKAEEYKASRSGPEYVDDGVEPVPNMAELPQSFVDPGAAAREAAAKEAAAKALAEAMAAFEAARAELDEAIENEALLLKRHQRLSTTPGGAADAAEDAYKAGKRARETAAKALLAATERVDSLVTTTAPTTTAPTTTAPTTTAPTTAAPSATTTAPTTAAPNATTAAPNATDSRAKVTLLDRNLPAHKEYFGSIITDVYGSTLWKKDTALVQRAKECLDEQHGRLIMVIGQEWNFQDIRSVVVRDVIRGDL